MILVPRPAATVMVLRDPADGTGLEVFLMRRHPAMDFAAGMTVFPGGGVDDRDRDAVSGRVWAGPPPAWWADRFGVDEPLAAALVCAAVRETFEETGVLFAAPAADPAGIVGDASGYAAQRAALAAHRLTLTHFLLDARLVLRADLLRPWANWVTPQSERTRRYDTYFFVAALPAGQHADGDNVESDRAFWAAPHAAIADSTAGSAPLLPPTRAQLDSLLGATMADVMAAEPRIVRVLR